jgi:branched-chain amino acid transport system substrate-binding protein
MKAKKLVSLIVLSLCVMAFCWGSALAAEKKGPIHFVMVTDLTGPAHAQIAPAGWVTEDYLNWLNKTKGGINGHPIKITIVDSKYQLPLARTTYARLKGEKQTTISFDDYSGGIEALKLAFAADKVPVSMYTGHGPALYPTGWVVAHMPPYDDVLCAYANWIKKNWKESRKPRIALLLGDYAAGRAPEQAKWYVEKVGIEVVSIEYIPQLPTDTSDQLIRMRDKKPDFVFDTLMPDQLKVILKDRLKLGIKIPQANFFFNSDQVKATVPLEGYIGYMGFQATASWWEKDVPGVKLAYELYKHRGPVPNWTYVTTLAGVMGWVEAVKNALETVGYENLDGPAIMNGYLKIRNFKAMGLHPGLNYYKDDLRGGSKVKLCIFNKDGSISNLTDYFEAPHNLKLKAQAGIK